MSDDVVTSVALSQRSSVSLVLVVYGKLQLSR